MARRRGFCGGFSEAVGGFGDGMGKVKVGVMLRKLGG
jgi:hypothetical protein